MLLYPLTNIEIQKNYQNKPKFKDIYSQNNLLKTMKNGVYIVNLDEYKSTGTHWITVSHVIGNSVKYFDNFGVEHIPEEIKRFITNKQHYS